MTYHPKGRQLTTSALRDMRLPLSTRSWVGPDGSASTLTVSVQEATVSISCNTKSEMKTAKAFALPAWSGLEHTKSKLIFPPKPHLPVVITLDREPQPLYSLWKSDGFPEAPPSVIERDRRFISSTRLLLESADNTGGRDRDASRSVESGRKRKIHEAELDSNKDIYRQRRL